MSNVQKKMIRVRVLALLLAATVGLAAQGTAPAAVDPFRDFPSYDRDLAWRIRNAMSVKEVERERVTSPGSASTIQHLLEHDQFAEAIAGVRVAVQSDTESMIASLKAVQLKMILFRMDRGRRFAPQLAEAVAPARARLAGLNREDAARLANVLIRIEGELQFISSGKAGPDSRRQFVQDYDGTTEAALVAVDLVQPGRDIARILSELDALVKAHPGSAAGAKALYRKGSELGSSGLVAEPRGGDPTPRFLQVVAIVDELESGRYPDCEWVRNAPNLISGFYVSESQAPQYAEGNVDRTLAEYSRYIDRYFDRNTAEDLVDSNINYIITSRMGPLFERKGEDRIAAIDRLLTDFETRGRNKARVELFRGQWLAGISVDPRKEQPALARRAEDILQAVSKADAGYYSRKALAQLAGFLFWQRDCVRALPAFSNFAQTYPASPWAWVARLRAGQCTAELGDYQKAAGLFASIAKDDSKEPAAVVLSATLAGRAFDAIGQFDRSLASYTQALAAWDPDFGADLPVEGIRKSLPSPTGEVPGYGLTKDQLTDRVAALERHLADPSGSLVERGVWLIDHRQFAEAKDTLTRAEGRARSDAAKRDARMLRHRAELEAALDLAAIEGRVHDDAAALKALDVLMQEPFDGAVGAAGVARATILFKRRSIDAGDAMLDALSHWVTAQSPLRQQKPENALAAEVAAIREVVFRPAGGLDVLSQRGWNAFTFPASIRYAIVNAEVRVKAADGRVSRVRLLQDLPQLPGVVFLTPDEIALLSRLIPTLGGTKTRATVDVMETPNQPIGSAVDVMKFWDRYFPTRQGHWGGWVVETYPVIGQVEFLNAERTKAEVAVTVGYSGCTIVMEKTNGQWKAIEAKSFWVT